MNVWIFVISVLFTPVVEPLGFGTEEAAPAPVVDAPPMAVAASIEAEPRFHGIERMLAELDASQR